ncbi:hypothetical protein JZ751_010834 [Albula glossodonta]|uniref:RNA-binding protein 15B n=1 Tax=Albula glossodonta TaxID=121402 RepID=A0A8T2MPM0_9TELE|nr:hypothetical protein JZ751_004287 [Albula glossodonta]KAG9333618.1 hypothetical protein JZ751_010834 [Albula glossodonta]
MKRQAERDSSPARGISKRIRERERDRDGSRRDDCPTTPLAALLADSRNYHKLQARSRSREREKPRLREERGAASDLHHRQQYHHDIGLIGRPPLRTTTALPKPSKVAAELLSTRGAGSQEYKTLLISNLGSQLPDDHVEDGLFHEFKKFGDVSIKLSHTPELGRVAYVNFRHPDDAKEARHAKARLVLYDRPLKVEPMYLRRRSCTPPDVGGSNIRDARSRHYAVEGLGLSRERERSLDYYSLIEERARAHQYQQLAPAPEELKPEDDQRATRNLFIGNLDHNVSEPELRRSFEKYGVIEEVIIKRPARGQGGAYAFLKFQNLDMAHRAKVAMQGRVVGGNPVKIGYGKANPTTRLWVGGLGPSTSLAALAREFDRFGSIRTVDYVKGESFAYIQYESLDAAQAACAQMRGFPLGGSDRRLRVDFAKAEVYPPQYPAPVPVPTPVPHYDLLADCYSQRRSLEREPRGPRDRSPPRGPYERERGLALGEREWTSPARSLERVRGRGGRSRSRSRERWGKERDAVPAERRPKAREDWRKRRSRSLSGERPSPPLPDSRGRARARRAAGNSRSPSGSSSSPDRGSPIRPRGRVVEPPRERTPQAEEGEVQDEPASHPPHPNKGAGPEPDRNHGGGETEARAEEKEAEAQTPSDIRKLTTLPEYARTLNRVWQGLLVLKNSCFSTHVHMLEGGPAFLRALLRDSQGQGPSSSLVPQLKIAQRLRLDQPKLDEVTRRIRLGGPDQYAVLLAVQGPYDRAAPTPEPGLQHRLLRNLVNYLRSKQAAGVVGLPLGGAREQEETGMLYAFPPGDFSQLYLKDALRTVGSLEEPHLLMVVVKDSV